jgi:hypothetical protein
MSSRLPRAVLCFCIRVDASTDRLDRVGKQAVESLGERLFESLAVRQIPATWAVAEPATSTIVKRVAASLGGQEIALAVSVDALAGTVWESRELERRVAQVRGLGLPLVSAVVDGALQDVHYETLARLELSAASRPGTAAAPFARRRTQAPTPRYGGWCFAVSCSLPGASRWAAGGGGGGTAKREIDLAVRDHGLVQLAVDLPRLVERGRAAERVLARVVDLVERRRGLGQLDIATLGSTAARLSLQCHGKPSRSILRPAA